MSEVQTTHLVSANVERSEPQTIHPPSGRVERSEGRAFSQDSILISVVMPCLNESRTLAACITEARAGCEAALISRSALVPGSLHYEILIADNGSTDGSQEIAIANGARVIPVEQKGYGAALLGGFAAAQGKYIVMGDSDSSYDFGDIPKLIAKLEEGNDLVLGNRFAGGIQPGAMPWHHRYIGNPILSGFGRLLYRTPCRDWHCGLRAFDREKMVALQLQSTGMEFASEMVLRASQAKLRMAEVSTTLRPDGRDRPPHLRSFRDGLRHLIVLGTDGLNRYVVTTEKLVLLLCVVIASAFLLLHFSGLLSNARDNDDGRLEGHFVKDFGEVSEGTMLSHSFPIEVVGSGSITISRIRTSCQCMFLTDDEVVGKEFAPGSRFNVQLGLKVGEAINDLVATATLEYISGSSSHVANLRILATVPADYRLSSDEVDLGLLREADHERRFQLQIFSDSTAKVPITIINASSQDPRVSVEIINEGNGFIGTFSQPDFGREQKIDIPIVVTTTSNRKRKALVYLRGEYQPNVVLKPSSVLIGSRTTGNRFNTTLVVHTTQRAEVDVDSSVQRLCNVRQVGELEWLIEVDIDLNKSKSLMSLPIRIRLSDGTCVVKSVPIVSFKGEYQ